MNCLHDNWVIVCVETFESLLILIPIGATRLTRFLQATRSSGSLPISFQLSPVHSFSRPHCPLAPSTSHSSSALSILSPGHTVIWLPPHLIQAQPCPFFLQATRSSGSLHISFKLSPVHSFSRPHAPLAPSTSHSSSALSILAPGHTLLWLPPHLIQAQPCPFFLQATRSSGSLHISFKLSHVHSFSRPHGPLAPSTSHSSSALSILSPGHTVLWLPPHLIQTQPCPFFLQATRSTGSLHISFKLSHVHSFSRPHGPLAPSTSHSSSALSILSPGHTVLWLPHLIPTQPCPFFLQATRSSGSLHISFKLSPVHSFSRPHGPLAPSTSHSSSALSILSPGHTVLWLPHLIPTQPCPFFLQATRSSGSLHISFKLSPVHSFSRPHGPLAPSTSHSSSALSILSPGHTLLWLPPHLIQAQPCPFFLQATRSSGSLHISFKLSPVHSFSRPHAPLAPSTSHSCSAMSILSPGHTVLWLPSHLIQAQPCPFFLQATRSSGSLHISFMLSPVHSFSRPHAPLAPSTYHSCSALSVLSPGHTALWLPPHLIQAQPCPFFLQATRSSGSLHISFKLSPVHSFSRPHGPLAPSTSHSSSALSILSPSHTVLWLPPHLNQAQPCPFFLQATRSSGSLHISFKLSPVHSFSRPHGPLAPSTSHSSSALSILSPGHTVLWLPPHLIQAQPCPFFLQATRSSGSLHISFKLSPVHPFSRSHAPLAPSTSHSSSALSILSPGHTVLWLPPHLIQAQPCPSFLQVTCSSGSLHISFKLSPVHSFSRPHGPLAPSTSHSSSALSILSPGHMLLWLPPHLIQAQPCPFFLQVTWSSGSLHISFKLSPVHSFSRSHAPLAPSTSHSSSALSILSPGHTVLWLPSHLIQAQPCPFFLQVTWSSDSLHISFKLSPVHSFSRSHGPLAPFTSHSSSALSILSPGHTVLWLPSHLIPTQPCPFFLQVTCSSGSLHISFQLSTVHYFSRPHGLLASSTSHSSSALSILSPDHTVLWLPPHLIQAQPCPSFLQVTCSSGSLHISFKLSPVHSFSRPHGPLAPSTSHSSSALSILSPGHMLLWLPPHLIQAQPCPFFLQVTRSSGSLHIAFKLSPVHSFSRSHGPLAPSTSHSSSALSILSPGHMLLWLPPHLIQAQPCPFFLQVTCSSGSLHISFKLSPVHSFSRSHAPLAPSTSHSSSALSILSPGHTVLWLPSHLIQAQPCPFFLQVTWSSGSLHISFQLSTVHYFSRPHGLLASSTSHSSSALSILSPDHTVLWLPPHLIQAQPCPFFLQVTCSSGSLHISFQLSPVHSFSRPHSPLAPSTSHSSSGSLHISFQLSPVHSFSWPHSGSLHISFKLSPVHSFTSTNHCLAGLPCDLFPSTIYCKMVFFRVLTTLTTCPKHLTFPLLNNLQQHVIISHVPCNSHCISKLGICAV